MSEIHKTLSVRQRLWTLGAASLVGFGSVIAVGWYQNTEMRDALDRATAIQNSLASVNEMRIANLDLVLTAMDTIIDRDEKVVQPARAATIEASLQTLAAGAADMKALAAQLDDSAALSTFDADIAELRTSIQTDLAAMVANGAPLADYARLDDVVDGAGARVGSMLATLAKDGGALVRTRVEEATAISGGSIFYQTAFGILALIVTIALQAFHGGSLRRGIAGVRESMREIIDGNYDAPVSAIHRGDEIGDMARSTELFRAAAVEKLSLEEQADSARRQADQERRSRDAQRVADEKAVKDAVDALADGLNRLAGGDMTVSLNQPFRTDLEQVRNDFNRTTDRLRQVMSEISDNGTSIQANSQQMRASADDLARRTEQQAASLEQTSAALDQITATVRNATQRAEEAGQMVEQTRSNTEKSGKIVADAMAAMERIEDAGREIGNIINAIDEIAFQTNLLALNAGVEAARAGEAGKGFAVVAQEVRELAGRAATAAKDIKTLVTKSSTEVKSGVELVTATGDALNQIGEEVVRVNEHVKSIVTSAREQSVGLAEINDAVGQMDQATQKNAAMVEETNAASHTLAGDAENLARLVGQFKIRDGASAAHAPRPATAVSRPSPSPARTLVTKLAGAFSNGSAARKPAATSDNWEEF